MRIVQPSFEIMAHTKDIEILIEKAIRTAYKSEDRIEPGSAEKIITLIKTMKHESTLEHGSVTVRFIIDRGVSHELVRHRIASYTQESTRYCNYSKGKFGGEITVVKPFFFEVNTENYKLWSTACEATEALYLGLLANGAKAQEARSILPNSLKTEVVMTANIREWRSVLNLRTSIEAHPQIRQVMCPLLASFQSRWPTLFGDVGRTDHPCPAKELVNAD